MSFFSTLNRAILVAYCDFKKNQQLKAIQENKEILENLLYAKAGVIGEEALIKKLKIVLTDLKIDHLTHIDYGLNDAVLVFKNNTSYEIDLIVLTEIGLYVIEVKNWWGEVKIANEPGKLELKQFQKGTVLRSDPSETNYKKMNALLRPLTQRIYCFAPVIFTNPETKLDTDIPNHILHIDNLEIFFKAELEAAEQSQRAKLPVKELSKELFGQLDPDPKAKHYHMMRMPETEENSAKLYHTTQRRLELLELGMDDIQVSQYTFGSALKDLLFSYPKTSLFIVFIISLSFDQFRLFQAIQMIIFLGTFFYLMLQLVLMAIYKRKHWEKWDTFKNYRRNDIPDNIPDAINHWFENLFSKAFGITTKKNRNYD